MIISASIISKAGIPFLADFLPEEVRLAAIKHANKFLYALEIEDDEVDLPYVETSHLRYTYKQTGDLYWVLVTNPDSNITSDVDLLGRFVCTIMEYGASETNSSTITDEQKELYYRHLWRPWDEDAQCPSCGRHSNLSDLWERDFGERLRYLREIRDGHVADDDVSYFNKLITESWLVKSRLTQNNNSNKHDLDGHASESDSFDSTSDDSETASINEETLIDGVQLKCRLEDICLATRRLQTPYLRLFVRRDLLAQSDLHSQTLLGSAPCFGELDTTCVP